MVQGQGRQRPVPGSARPDSRKAMAFRTRVGSLLVASALAIAASHMAGGVSGPAIGGSVCCAIRAMARPGSNARQKARQRSMTLFVHEYREMERVFSPP